MTLHRRKSVLLWGVQPSGSVLHTGGGRGVLGHTLNTLRHLISKKSCNVSSKFAGFVGPHSQPSGAACGPWAAGCTPLVWSIPSSDVNIQEI